MCLTRRVNVVAGEREVEEERARHAVKNDEYAGVMFVEEDSNERVHFVLHIILLESKDE